MPNSQGEIFNRVIDEALSLLSSFVTSVYENGDSVLAKQRVINFFIDLYSQSYLDELSYILDQFDFDLTPTDKNNIRNGVSTSSFYRTNQSRLATILNSHEEKIREFVNNNPDMSLADIVNHFEADMFRLGVSETQIGIEQASVDSAVVVEFVSETKLNKTWNSLLDKRTCPTCVALHGTTIPVTESFASYTNNPDILEDLSYTGGGTAYAHPHCRCWLTYSTA